MLVEEKSHAKLGPSGWDRWSNCPGSVALSDGLPNKSSIYAAEGTVAHEVADRVLRGVAVNAAALLGEMFQVDGFDIIVDDEMVEAVTRYVDLCRSIPGTLLPEQQVPIGHLTGETGAAGTSDCIVIDDGTMTVVDLKYGKGVRVNAEGNGQGRIYALGALQKFGMVYDISQVRIMIVQPRLEDGVSEELLSIGELMEFKDQVEIAAGMVEIGAGNYQPGEKQCKFCPAKGICPALAAEVSSSMQLVSTVTAADFADLTMPKQAASVTVKEASTEKLAEFLRAVPLIEAAIAGVRGEVERRLFDGQEVPGFYLGVGKRGNRQWLDQAEVEATLKRKRIKVAEIFERKLVSPAKAEKMLKSNPKVWAAVSELITQEPGKPSVCQEGDANPPFILVSADDFADLPPAVDLLA